MEASWNIEARASSCVHWPCDEREAGEEQQPAGVSLLVTMLSRELATKLSLRPSDSPTFGPRLVHMPSEPSGSQRSPVVSSGRSFAQVAGAILRKQAQGQNPDKDAVPGGSIVDLHQLVVVYVSAAGIRRRSM